MPAQIKHLFVLMMENLSFDHLFGFTSPSLLEASRIRSRSGNGFCVG
jgi:hypothetical protein